MVRAALDGGADRVARLRAAETHLRAAVLERPSEPRSHALLGLALDRQGRFPEAAEAWRCAWALAPRDLDHEMGFAVALCASGRYREAVPHFERVAEARPRSAEALVNLGLALRESGELEAALGTFERAAALAPRRARVAVERGLTLRSLGRVDEALAAFDAALAIDPDDVEAHHRKGRLLLRRGRHAEAAEALEAARARAPRDPEIRRALAELAQVPMGEDDETVAVPTLLAPELSADLARFPVPELVEFLGMSRRTGILDIEAGEQRGELEMFEGRLLSGRSSGQPSFLERLIEMGVRVPPGLVDFELGRGAGPLLEVLLEEGLVEPPLVDELAFRSAVDALLALVRLAEGRAEFRAVRGEACPRARQRGTEAQGVLLEAYRRIDEAEAGC